MPVMTVEQFSFRLATLCLQSGGIDLPRRQLDRHILFRSVAQTLEPSRTYTENELNLAIEAWLSEVGQSIQIDHVTLRRLMVDERYLKRDAAGAAYRLFQWQREDLFDPAVGNLDPARVIREAIETREQQKKRYNTPPDTL